jgi:two-component system sensor histidine kinase KdpD
MIARLQSALMLKSERPPLTTGVIVALAGVGLATAVIYPLKSVAPVVSLAMIYLLAVVFVATFWGLALGIATGVLSGVAFNFFHLPPVGHLTIADSRNWVALVTFIFVAIATGLIAETARSRATEADQRRREADLSAELARLLLGAARLQEALPVAAQRVAAALGVSSAALELRTVEGDERRLAFGLVSDGQAIGTLLLPASLREPELARVRERIVPSLESILAAARHRAELQAEVVETAALRRNDEMKTALLRSVSHDLRTPLTAILTAAGAFDAEHPTSASVAEAQDVVLVAATRLWRLIDKLLDLSLLQGGRLEPKLDWYSLEEVLQEAAEHVPGSADTFNLSIGQELPLLRGDPGQLERAFANVLENAARYSAGKPVSVRVRMVGSRIRVRIVDQGPGIPPGEQERIFLPFYRASVSGQEDAGSGLGLAIARGFIEVNGGRITVESLPGQGTSFVVQFPLPDLGPQDAPDGAASTAIGV